MKSSSPEVSSILDSSSVSSESYSDSVSELSRTTSSFFLALLLVILPMLKSREFFDNCVYRRLSWGVLYQLMSPQISTPTW